MHVLAGRSRGLWLRQAPSLVVEELGKYKSNSDNFLMPNSTVWGYRIRYKPVLAYLTVGCEVLFTCICRMGLNILIFCLFFVFELTNTKGRYCNLEKSSMVVIKKLFKTFFSRDVSNLILFN